MCSWTSVPQLPRPSGFHFPLGFMLKEKSRRPRNNSSFHLSGGLTHWNSQIRQSQRCWEKKKERNQERKGKERQSPEEVAENPAGAHLVHNSRALTSQGSLNYNPVHYIWMSWLVYCWCEICSCNCGNAEFTEYKESTVAAGSPGEGSQIPAQASPYQALALSSTHG